MWVTCKVPCIRAKLSTAGLSLGSTSKFLQSPRHCSAVTRAPGVHPKTSWPVVTRLATYPTESIWGFSGNEVWAYWVWSQREGWSHWAHRRPGDGSPQFLAPTCPVPTTGTWGGARPQVKTKVPSRCRYVCVGLSLIIPAYSMPTLGRLISLPLS